MMCPERKKKSYKKSNDAKISGHSIPPATPTDQHFLFREAHHLNDNNTSILCSC